MESTRPEDTQVSTQSGNERSIEAQLRKTELECRLLAQQLTPEYRRIEWLKGIAAASGLVIAIVAVIGGFGSIAGWLIEQQKSRQVRIEERLDRALTMLADPSANRRLAAISSLRSFLAERDDTRNSQVLLALSSTLALEDSDPVRSAITSLVADVDPAIVGSSVLNRGLQALVDTSRGLVRDGDLGRKRPRNLWRLETDLKVGANLQMTADAIVSLLRKGARAQSMTGIYLGRSDLAGLDLSGTDFGDATLAWSDLSRATLRNSSFDGADLERTNFVSADLQNAKFTLTNNGGRTTIHWNYVQQQMDRSSAIQVQVEMPDFHCSDLRNADFSGHPLFGIIADDISELAFVEFPAKFARANLKGADFSRIQIFGLRSDHDNRSPFVETQGGGSRPNDAKYIRGSYQIDSDAPLTGDINDFTKSLNRVSHAFAETNWSAAKLPRGIRQWLEQHRPGVQAPRIVGEEPCQPRATADDQMRSR
jgi:uncharacterized protein YjbI with pentapeptide repeats